MYCKRSIKSVCKLPESEKETSVSSDLSRVEREAVVGEGGCEPSESEDERTFSNSRSSDHRHESLIRFVLDIRRSCRNLLVIARKHFLVNVELVTKPFSFSFVVVLNFLQNSRQISNRRKPVSQCGFVQDGLSLTDKSLRDQPHRTLRYEVGVVGEQQGGNGDREESPTPVRKGVNDGGDGDEPDRPKVESRQTDDGPPFAVAQNFNGPCPT